MATTSAGSGNAKPIQPAFKRVPMQGSHDDVLACIATICGKTLEEVTETAIGFGMPRHGPYWLTEDHIAKIFMAYNFVSGSYKEFTKNTHPPLCCLIIIDYDSVAECGRHVICVNQNGSRPYCIDVGNWLDESLHVRELSTVKPAWYMPIHPAAQKPGKS